MKSSFSLGKSPTSHPHQPSFSVWASSKVWLKIKHLGLTIHFISLLKRKLSIKWKAICIFSTKDSLPVGFQPLLNHAICLRAIDFLKVSCEVVRARRGAWWTLDCLGQHCSLCPFEQGSILFLECPGWQAPYMGFTAPLLQGVKPQKHSLSQNSLLGTVLKKNGCCYDE